MVKSFLHTNPYTVNAVAFSRVLNDAYRFEFNYLVIKVT